ncbi:OsmC family protein [Massilia sp. CF038]|uniref:OsmC family protein n=1 Tax=Massilia sp. CF038 TaxID=1881045 RepID=UPI0009216291|nr:OsmC family protein [Massilia sp. CF038]SHH63527.1 Organic hydroperoxide reductase OsmC/OhrA [Massilia sp. CF038]
MQQFMASVTWQRGEQPFLDQRYSRAHQWAFDGGLQVPASSSPLSVPLPMSDPAALDPEEALVAALSSCHMLFFLSIAAQRGFVVDSYVDRAVGTMQKDGGGKKSMTGIVLRPAIVFGGERVPDAAARAAMHNSAHAQCYIANSIKAHVSIEEA